MVFAGAKHQLPTLGSEHCRDCCLAVSKCSLHRKKNPTCSSLGWGSSMKINLSFVILVVVYYRFIGSK